MNSLYRITLLLTLLSCATVSVGQVPNAVDRMNDFFLNATKLRESYSVICKEVEVQLSRTGEFVPRNSPHERVYRKICIDGKSMRLDERLVQGFDITQPIYTHSLVTPELKLWGVDTKPGGGIREMKGNMAKRVNPSLYPDIPYFSLASHSGLNGMATDFVKVRSESRYFDERELPGGGYRCLMAPRDGSAILEIKFASEPAWAPVQMRSFRNPGKPFDSSQATAETAKNWPEFCRTDTTWVKVKDDIWTPQKIVYFTRLETGDVNAEFETVDWKIGKEVDRSLLDPQNFTQEAIARTMDFDQWNSLFIPKK